LERSLCADGNGPKAVYMDVDYIYNTVYSVDVLRRNKQVLNVLGVDFGLNIFNQCANVSGTSAVNMTADFSALHGVDRSGIAVNLINEESMLSLVDYFDRQGILDAGKRLRMGSWSKRPVEQGVSVNEGVSGSLAHVANRIFDEYLIQRGLANAPLRQRCLLDFFGIAETQPTSQTASTHFAESGIRTTSWWQEEKPISPTLPNTPASR